MWEKESHKLLGLMRSQLSFTSKTKQVNESCHWWAYEMISAWVCASRLAGPRWRGGVK